MYAAYFKTVAVGFACPSRLDGELRRGRWGVKSVR
jgi:hypothetical protein